ncbi:MAG: metallophosphoesterase [Ruminococcus sp.]|nr:metallophosphoesterase [Ruminococcus sp.]
MIIVTGDIHGEYDIGKLKQRAKFRNMTKDDYLIICGDFGLVWDNSETDKWWREWLDQMPYTTLFVDGNHENFDLLYKFPEQNWHGGRIHRISDSIFHLMRGQIFDIDGKTFFTMGGAESHDKQFRKAGESWWEAELPSGEEYAIARRNLDYCGNTVDYIITHCAPTSIQKELIRRTWDTTYTQNELTDFLDDVIRTVTFDNWFCGHYHIDVTTLTEPRLRVMFNDLLKLPDRTAFYQHL